MSTRAIGRARRAARERAARERMGCERATQAWRTGARRHGDGTKLLELLDEDGMIDMKDAEPCKLRLYMRALLYS